MPDDFLDVAEDLARDGAYVLGLAVKRLGKKSIEELRQLCESRDKVEVSATGDFPERYVLDAHCLRKARFCHQLSLIQVGSHRSCMDLFTSRAPLIPLFVVVCKSGK